MVRKVISSIIASWAQKRVVDGDVLFRTNLMREELISLIYPTTRQFGWISTRLKARDNLRFEFPSRLWEFHRPFATRSPVSSWEGRNGNWGTQKISLPLVANTTRSGLDHHPSTHLRKIQRLPYRPIFQETSARSPSAQEFLKSEPMLAFNKTIILRKDLLYDN